ncbi:hypothetical protein KJZ63_04980 [Patescibacteria group bacterium]|nr:hypothetical protein [Patescibacteria group bacterium]
MLLRNRLGVEKEEKLKLIKELSGMGTLALMLAISFLAVSFPSSDRGFEVEDGEVLDQLNGPERLLAEKLLKLGLKVSHEKRQIKLDVGVPTNRKVKHTDTFKQKNLTAPDFYFHHDGVDCFIEVGSYRQNSHKREQEAVVKEAVSQKEGRKILYIQLFHDDISYICGEVLTAEELINYMYAHPSAIFATQSV